jgi:hypothetical protein
MRRKIAGLVVAIVVSALSAAAQRGEPVRQDPPVPTGPPVNSASNPYHTIPGWYQWPEGRAKGSIPAVAVSKNDHIWVIERCGITGFIAAACADSKLDPIFEFDQSGKILHNWGGGMFVFPHGIGVDADGNVWVTDGQAKDGKGHQVFKFSPDGKVLMTLGTRGVAGGGPSHFNQPNAVAFAPNGDVFIGEGHGGENGDRIVKFTKDGKYIKEWGRKGSGPGEFDIIHHIAFDSEGASTLPTATTIASRFSIRMERSSSSTPSSADRAASRSTGMMSCMCPTPSRNRFHEITTDGNAGFALGASRTKR